MIGEHLAPMTLCLLASLIWAPAVYAIASGLGRGRSLAAAELVWIVALAIAALPTAAAPALSAASLSLRPAPVVAIEANASAAAAQAPAARAVIPSGAPEAAPAAAAHPLKAEPALTLPVLLNAAGLVYLYGLLLALAIYAFRSAAFAREISRARPVAHAELERELGHWARRLGVAAPFRIVRSDAVATVCLAGFIRPKIVIPTAAGARFSFADLVMMGAHELAHVRRGDQALFFAAAMARAFFWFNPFVKRIAARAELAAEESADALVLANGVDRRRYAACFVEGLKFAADARGSALAATPSFTPFDRRARRDRLDAILSGKPVRTEARAVAAIAIAAFAAGAAAIAQAALAVEPAPKIVELPAGGPASAGDVEFSTKKGAPARALADGVVAAATDLYRGRPDLGKVVVVKADDGGSIRYARLESYGVKKGDRVRRGDVLGIAGAGADLTIWPAKEAAIGSAAADEPATASAPRRPRTPALPAAPAAPGPVAPITPPAPQAAPAPAAAPQAAAAQTADLDALLAGAPDAGPNPGAGRGRDHAAADAPFFPPEASLSLSAPDGGAFYFRSENGRTKWGVRSADGAIVWTDGDGLSDEDRARFEAGMAEARAAFDKARARHAGAAEAFRFSFGDFGLTLDGADIDRIRERAAADAQRLAAWMKLSKGELDRIRREAARAAADARSSVRESGRDLERMFDETWPSVFDRSLTCRGEACDDAAESAAERLERAAERAAARAEAEAERAAARAEAEAEREAARAEAETERQLLESELEERVEALAEAERDLAAERAELDRLRAEIEAARRRAGSI